MKPAVVCAAALSGWVVLAAVAAALFVIRCFARADDDALRAMAEMDVPPLTDEQADVLFEQIIQQLRHRSEP